MNRSLVRLGAIAGAAIALAGCSTYGTHRGHGYSGVSIGYATSRPHYGWRDSDRRHWEGRRDGDHRGRDNRGGHHRDRHDRGHR